MSETREKTGKTIRPLRPEKRAPLHEYFESLLGRGHYSDPETLARLI